MTLVLRTLFPTVKNVVKNSCWTTPLPCICTMRTRLGTAASTVADTSLAAMSSMKSIWKCAASPVMVIDTALAESDISDSAFETVGLYNHLRVLENHVWLLTLINLIDWLIGLKKHRKNWQCIQMIYTSDIFLICCEHTYIRPWALSRLRHKYRLTNAQMIYDNIHHHHYHDLQLINLKPDLKGFTCLLLI